MSKGREQMSSLTMMQQVDLPTTAVGWVTVLTGVFGFINFVLAVHYAFKVKPFVEQVRAWQVGGVDQVATVRELNQVGAKHDALRIEMVGIDAKVQANALKLHEHDAVIGLFREVVGENRAWMERVSEEQRDVREQIMGHVSQSTGKLTDSLNSLAIHVAVLDERVKNLNHSRE